jgi:hypothetical protein
MWASRDSNSDGSPHWILSREGNRAAVMNKAGFRPERWEPPWGGSGAAYLLGKEGDQTLPTDTEAKINAYSAYDGA